MVQKHVPIVDITDRSDGRVLLWRDADNSHVYEDQAGAVATDTIWDAAGDLAVGSGANTAARLAIGATDGMVLMRVGGAVVWAFPPGHEFDYVEFTGNLSVTATTEGTAQTVVASNSIAYDGSTVIQVEFQVGDARPANDAASRSMNLWLFEDTTSLGYLGLVVTPAAGNARRAVFLRSIKITPSAASHVYTVKASVSATGGVINSGAGGAGASMPGYIRIVKA